MAISSIFVNLPVADLEASKAFYTGLGFTINPLFTNDDAACVVISEHLYVMLLMKPFFSTFTAKTIIDARTEVQVINALAAEARDEVDEVLARGVGAGGSESGTAQDHGFMYSRNLEDPDGHLWEVMWMDPAAAEAGPPAA